MRLKDWREVITLHHPCLGPITRETVEMIQRESLRFRGSMRMASGRIWEDESFNKYRQKELRTPLP